MFMLALKADRTPYLSLNLYGSQSTCEISRKGSPRTLPFSNYGTCQRSVARDLYLVLPILD